MCVQRMVKVQFVIQSTDSLKISCALAMMF